MERPLSYRDFKKILTKLTGAEIVLVGGQALNIWAEYYLPGCQELAATGPYVSKDIDFCAAPAAVIDCANRLSLEPILPKDFEPTPNTGAVIFLDEEGEERQIDFLERPFGLLPTDVFNTAIPYNLLDEDGNPTEIRIGVMHPERCMESRVHNVIGLRQNSAHALKQLRASVICAREFQKDLLGRGLTRLVLKLNERIFDFCLRNHNGVKVFSTTGIDPFDAVICSPELPEAFAKIRYPQMQARLTEKRRRLQNLFNRR